VARSTRAFLGASGDTVTASPSIRAPAARRVSRRSLVGLLSRSRTPAEAGDRRRLRADPLRARSGARERGEKGLLATGMASPTLPRGWRKQWTPTVTADRVSKTRSEAPGPSPQIAPPRNHHLHRSCVQRGANEAGQERIDLRDSRKMLHNSSRGAKLNIMFSSDGLEIGTGSSNSPRSANESQSLGILRSVGRNSAQLRLHSVVRRHRRKATSGSLRATPTRVLCW
jgi:hypothetical protein